MASKCSSFYHQSGRKVCHRYRTHSGFTPLEPNPTFHKDRTLVAKTKYLRRKRTIVGLSVRLSESIRPNCLLPYRKYSGFPPLGPNRNIQLWQVLASKDDYWRLGVRLSTINPSEKFATVIERAQVLRPYNQTQHSTKTGH